MCRVNLEREVTREQLLQHGARSKKKFPPLLLEATIITNVQMKYSYEIWGMAVTYYT
jgi:hypothetical protein